ncbi:MAG TPA: sugar phosphate isomerase/epimerase family protein [Clostridia bacterium]|nr:sugar phosphate isomerase/epimerase family protein [Clostridia bacterium]
MSTYVHVRERLHPGLLDELSRGGAQAIEVFASRGHFDYTNRQHVREIANWFGTSGVEFNSMHSPMFNQTDWGNNGAPPLNIASIDRKSRIDAMDEIKRAIEVAEQVPFRFLIQHIGTGGENYDEHKFDAALTSLEHLRAFAKPLGVRLLVENIPNELSTPDRLLELIRISHFEDVGVCFDFGHAHLGEGVEVEFDLLKEHIRSTHVHDNKKDRDTHLWPGDGSIDWTQAMELLHSAPHVPPILMEIDGDPQGDPEFGKVVPVKMQQAWTKLERADATA